MVNPFFKNYGPFNIIKILELLNLNSDGFPIQEINNITDLNTATTKDITFLHSKKYTEISKLTKASFCICIQLTSTICYSRTFYKLLFHPQVSIYQSRNLQPQSASLLCTEIEQQNAPCTIHLQYQASSIIHSMWSQIDVVTFLFGSCCILDI